MKLNSCGNLIVTFNAANQRRALASPAEFALLCIFSGKKQLYFSRTTPLSMHMAFANFGDKPMRYSKCIQPAFNSVKNTTFILINNA